MKERKTIKVGGKVYRRHVLSAKFADLDDRLLGDLVVSLSKTGLLNPVIVNGANESEVLDGWQRLRALAELERKGIRIEVRTVAATRSPADEAYGYNITRRNQTPEERARAAIELEEWRVQQYRLDAEDEAARLRVRGRSNTKIAAEAGVGRRTVDNVKRKMAMENAVSRTGGDASAVRQKDALPDRDEFEVDGKPVSLWRPQFQYGKGCLAHDGEFEVYECLRTHVSNKHTRPGAGKHWDIWWEAYRREEPPSARQQAAAETDEVTGGAMPEHPDALEQDALGIPELKGKDRIIAEQNAKIAELSLELERVKRENADLTEQIGLLTYQRGEDIPLTEMKQFRNLQDRLKNANAMLHHCKNLCAEQGRRLDYMKRELHGRE